MIESIDSFGLGLVGATWWTVVAWPVIWALALIKIVVVLVSLMGWVAYLTLWERQAIGFTQLRFGPNRVGPSGLQIMRLDWKILIPVTLVWLVVVGAWMQTSWNI